MCIYIEDLHQVYLSKSFYAFLGMVTDGQHNYPVIFNEVEYVCILYTYWGEKISSLGMAA